MSAAYSAGVEVSGSPPSRWMRFCTSGSSAELAQLGAEDCRRSPAACRAAPAARNAARPRSPASPTSSKVGTSGNSEKRFLLVTAMARSCAGLDIAERRRQHAERDRHVAAEQIVHDRRRALVGDDRDVDAGFGLEQFGAHVAAGADRRGADIELARLLLGKRDDFGDRLGRKRRMGEQRHRHRGDQADRREILARVHAELGVEAGVDRERAGMAEQQRVAVGRGARDGARADGAAAAAAVVDDHLLVERVGQLLRHHARHGVDAAAGRIGHHERDIAGRKFSRVATAPFHQRAYRRRSPMQWRSRRS